MAFSYLFVEKISCSAELSMKTFYNLGPSLWLAKSKWQSFGALRGFCLVITCHVAKLLLGQYYILRCLGHLCTLIAKRHRKVMNGAPPMPERLPVNLQLTQWSVKVQFCLSPYSPDLALTNYILLTNLEKKLHGCHFWSSPVMPSKQQLTDGCVNNPTVCIRTDFGPSTITILWANSADVKLMILFLFFPENSIWHFMKEDNLHEMPNPIFQKNKKNISKCHPLKFLHSMLMLNTLEKTSSRRHTEIFFLIFQENRIWCFMQIVSNGGNMHEMSNPVFWKNRTIFQNVIC